MPRSIRAAGCAISLPNLCGSTRAMSSAEIATPRRRTARARRASSPTMPAASHMSSPAASASASASRAPSRLNPELIVLDEPVSALDVSVQAQIVNLLADLQERLNLTYIFIAHDLAWCGRSRRASRSCISGRSSRLGPADDIFARPAHPYTQALISAVPVPDVTGQRRAQAHRAQRATCPARSTRRRAAASIRAARSRRSAARWNALPLRNRPPAARWPATTPLQVAASGM